MTTLGTSSTRMRTPQGMKVAPMSYAKLEPIAKDLRSLLPMVKFRGHERIDCWRVLEHVLPNAGFRYYIASESELKDIAAFTVPERGLVVVRADVYDGLFEEDVFSRSTIIHELTHIVLRHAATLHRGAVLGQHGFHEDSEWQAKALTAATMMPFDLCCSGRTAHEIAYICGTSVQSATYRLAQLTKAGHIKQPGTSGLFDTLP